VREKSNDNAMLIERVIMKATKPENYHEYDTPWRINSQEQPLQMRIQEGAPASQRSRRSQRRLDK
jgi:hypothetical protein